MKTELSLYEKLCWLNIDAKNNKKIYAKYEANYLYALAGLVIMELLLNQHIAWKNKDDLVGITENAPKDALLLEIWELCVIPNKISWFWFVGKKQTTAKNLQDWLQVITGKIPNFVKKVEQKLVAKKFMTVRETTTLGIIPKETIELKTVEKQEKYKKTLIDTVLLENKANIKDCMLLKIIKACKIHKIISPQTDTKNLAIFYEQLTDWTQAKIENEEIIRFLEGLEIEKDLEDMLEALDYLSDAIDGIADAIGDAGGDGGSDGGDGGGDGGGD
jgi:hypothetical protein